MLKDMVKFYSCKQDNSGYCVNVENDEKKTPNVEDLRYGEDQSVEDPAESLCIFQGSDCERNAANAYDCPDIACLDRD